jgi:hypothetical protein
VRVCVYIYIYHIFLTLSSIGRHVCCLYNLASVTSDAVNFDVQASPLYTYLHFIGFIPMSGIAGSYVVLLVFEEPPY